MKKNVLARPHSTIEALEGRIAPAVLVAGGNLLGGAGNPTSGDYAVGENSFAAVKVITGQAIVWFDDVIFGISVGPNTTLEINGSVFGDIVANLGADGRLSDSDNNPANGLDGNVLLPNAIKGIKIRPFGGNTGSVQNIVSGGSISGLNIAGSAVGIYAGDGVYHPSSDIGSSGSYDFSLPMDVDPIQPGMQGGFTLDKSSALMTPGAGIVTASIGEALELQVIAGSGNPTNAVFLNTAGPAGGNIDGLTIFKASVISTTSTTPSYSIIGGDGAAGKTGGVGGSITKLTEKSASGLISIVAGKGGDGLGGAGGAGGAIKLLDVSSLSGAYTLRSGDGGVGAPGGAGGTVGVVNYATVLQNSSLIAATDFDGDGTDELVIVAASSGDFVVAHSDDGGATFELVVQYFDLATGNPVYVISGAGLVSDLDVVASNSIMITSPTSGTIKIYTGSGIGDFAGADGSVETEDFSYSVDGFNAKYTQLIGDHLVVAAVNKGKTNIVSVGVGENAPQPTRIFSSSFEATAMTASGFGDTFVGFVSGQLIGISAAGSVGTTTVTLGGAVSSLSVGDSGTSLAALSKDRILSVFNISLGANLAVSTTVDLTATSGTLQQVSYINDRDPLTLDSLVVSHLTSTASYDFYQRAAQGAPYVLGTSRTSESAFKQFTIADVAGTFAIAGITASANLFGYSEALSAFTEYTLPFNGKQVAIFAGDGGAGINVGTLLGNGGAGGSISGVNIDAVSIELVGGAGGNSAGGAAGAGGSITNPASITTLSGAAVAPKFLALETLEMSTGSGGNALGAAGVKASGGAGGSFSGITAELKEGNMLLTSGNGGNGNGGAGGAGGAFNGFRATGNAAGIIATAGSGGSTTGPGAKAGAGAGFSNFNFTLSNEDATEGNERDFPVTLTAGAGGSSPAGIGGAGGGFSATTLNLDGSHRTYTGLDSDGDPVVDAELDSSVVVRMQAGNGGNGVTGGKGGDITGTRLSTIHDQIIKNIGVFKHYIAATLEAGNGGGGGTGDGGAGGNINSSVLTGVTSYDKDSLLAGNTPLVVWAGNGGTGGNKGGAGGGVSSLIAQNGPASGAARLDGTHLQSAEIYAGNGGDGGNSDGGAGGITTGLSVGVRDYVFTTAGNGGNGGVASGATAKGGIGGSISKSTLAIVYSPIGFAGLISTAGNGGIGRAAGGAGGGLAALTINIPFAPLGIGAVLTAGDGGAAIGTGGLGGKGGDVIGITNSKDIHGSVSLIEAGNGGNSAAGKGGNGGNVSSIKIAGFIGRVLDNATPLGAFDALGTASVFGAPVHTNLVVGKGMAQGLFVGRAGTGVTAGLAGSVSKVQAEAIAAIGAATDASGVFALAEKVSDVKASFIGYDVDGDSAFDAGVDGFILAKALSLVTGSRPGFIFNS